MTIPVSQKKRPKKMAALVHLLILVRYFVNGRHRPQTQDVTDLITIYLNNI